MPAKPRRNTRLIAAVAVDGRPNYAVAAAARMDPTTFGKIRTGQLDPTPPQQRRIADALHATVADLFDDQREHGEQQDDLGVDR